MRLSRVIYNAMREHAIESLPNECVGLLVADPRIDPDLVVLAWRAMNVDPDPRRGFLVGQAEQAQILAAVHRAGWRLVGVYHSHPQAEAAMSVSDLTQPYPGVAHVVIGMVRGLVMRAFTVSGGEVAVTPLEVVG